MIIQENYINLLQESLVNQGVKIIDFIETTTAVIFFDTKYAFKFKRPIQFQNLDYSSREKREFALNKEYKRNKLTGSDLYLSVEDLSLSSTDIEEPYLKLHRFNSDKLFRNLVLSKALNEKNVLEFVEKLTASHKESETVEFENKDQAFFNLHAIYENNIEEVSTNSELISNKDKEFLIEAIILVKEEILHRYHIGTFKECHSDLHLANICYYMNKLQFFDAIDIVSSKYNVDTYFDFAAFLVDLEAAGLESLYNLAFKEYLRSSGDEISSKLLHVYKIIRCCISIKFDRTDNVFKFEDLLKTYIRELRTIS